MRINRKAILAAAGVAATSICGLGAGSSAQAAPLSFDLRFVDDTHARLVNPGDVLQVDVWAVVSGTNFNHADDSAWSGYVVVQSTQVGGGAIASGTGGMYGGTRADGFNETASRDGGATDINGDGVLDWGSSSTDASNTNYMLVRNATIGGVPGGGTRGQAVDASTWEFKLASFSILVGDTGPGQTQFNVVKPNSQSMSSVPVPYFNSFVDGVAHNINSNNQKGAYAESTGITLFIPEPACVGAGAAAAAVLGRRRRPTQ